jgi:hypothetical protein
MKQALAAIGMAIALAVVLQFVSGKWKWPSFSEAISNASETSDGTSNKIKPSTTSETSEATSKPNLVKTESMPDPRAEDVIAGTPSSISRLPSVYRHRYVMLDEWKMGWEVNRLRPKSELPSASFAARTTDCDWYIVLAVASGACLSSGELEHIKQMGKNTAWGLPVADLLCYVEEASFGNGFLLTHCKPVPVPIDIEIYREQKRQALTPPVDFEP